MNNSNKLHGHARVRREGGERTLDAESIGRLGVLNSAVPSVGESMVREFALNGGSPSVVVTAEEQAEFRQLMRQMDEEYRAAISGDQLTAMPTEPGYAPIAEAVGVQTHRLGNQVVRSAQQELTQDLDVPNDGISPGYLAVQGELENA